MICNNLSVNEAAHLTLAGVDVDELANKYGTPKLFKTREDADFYLRKHKLGSMYGGHSGRYPYYEIKEEISNE